MGETAGGVLRRGSDRIAAGVCSGLAAYFGIEVVLVRVGFVILALTPPGIGIILYLVLWFLMDPPAGAPQSATRNLGDRFRAMGQEIREDFRSGFFRSQAGGPAPPPSGSPPGGHGWWGPGYGGRPRGLWAGILLIALGAYFLLENLGVLKGIRWELVWPVVLIVFGLWLLVRGR
jgi:phage shock protein C